MCGLFCTWICISHLSCPFKGWDLSLHKQPKIVWFQVEDDEWRNNQGHCWVKQLYQWSKKKKTHFLPRLQIKRPVGRKQLLHLNASWKLQLSSLGSDITSAPVWTEKSVSQQYLVFLLLHKLQELLAGPLSQARTPQSLELLVILRCQVLLLWVSLNTGQGCSVAFIYWSETFYFNTDNKTNFCIIIFLIMFIISREWKDPKQDQVYRDLSCQCPVTAASCTAAK